MTLFLVLATALPPDTTSETPDGRDGAPGDGNGADEENTPDDGNDAGEERSD